MKHWYRTPANGRNVSGYGNTRLTPEFREQLHRDRWLPVLVVGLFCVFTLAGVAAGLLP